MLACVCLAPFVCLVASDFMELLWDAVCAGNQIQLLCKMTHWFTKWDFSVFITQFCLWFSIWTKWMLVRASPGIELHSRAPVCTYACVSMSFESRVFPWLFFTLLSESGSISWRSPGRLVSQGIMLWGAHLYILSSGVPGRPALHMAFTWIIWTLVLMPAAYQ